MLFWGVYFTCGIIFAAAVGINRILRDTRRWDRWDTATLVFFAVFWWVFLFAIIAAVIEEYVLGPPEEL